MTAPDPTLVERLTERIRQHAGVLRQRIERFAVGEVRVVAVTKGHPVEVALAAMRAGFADLGENYAQELRSKADVIAQLPRGLDGDAERGRAVGPCWHFVGRLQRNKVRLIAADVSIWQSLDRPSVIDEVARRAPGSQVMIQVDLAGIEGRGGCDRADTAQLVRRAERGGLHVVGLMGVGVPGPPEASRDAFRWLRTEVDSLGLDEVSMGMSDDLDVALSEGATIIRVGTSLVGERSPRGATDASR